MQYFDAFNGFIILGEITAWHNWSPVANGRIWFGWEGRCMYIFSVPWSWFLYVMIIGYFPPQNETDGWIHQHGLKSQVLYFSNGKMQSSLLDSTNLHLLCLLQSVNLNFGKWRWITISMSIYPTSWRYSIQPHKQKKMVSWICCVF